MRKRGSIHLVVGDQALLLRGDERCFLLGAGHDPFEGVLQLIPPYLSQSCAQAGVTIN